MSIAYTVVTLVAAALIAFSAISVFTRAKWVVEPLRQYGVPSSWVPWLGTAKAAGALGLVVGLFIPAIGVLAAICLVLYFVGALITVARSRLYSHLPYPLIYMLPAAASLILGYAS